MPEDVGEQPSADQLLAEANLHRLRGEWPLAEDKCRRAIATNPRDAAAHTLLGDICAARERPDEAILAYRASLEVEDDELVRVKLERLLQAHANAAAQAVRQERRPRRGVLETRRLGLIAAVAFGVCAVALATVVIVTQLRGPRRAVPLTTQTRRAVPMPAFGSEGDEALSAPVGAAPAAAAEWRAAPPVGPPPATHALVQPTRSLTEATSRERNVIDMSRIPAPLTDREKKLVYELSQIRLSDNNPIGTPFVNASIDPGTEHLVVTFEVPVEVRREPSRSFIRVRAQELLLRASQVDDYFRGATVRVIVGWTDPHSGARHKDVVFRGEAKRASIEAPGAIGPGQARESILDDEWWNPKWGTALPPRFTRGR